MKKNADNINHLWDRCPICDTPMNQSPFIEKLSFEGLYYRIYRCRECGLGITEPAPEHQLLEKLYSSEIYRDNHSRFVGPVEKVLRHFREKRKRRIKKFIPKGQILDIGCGRGVFLAMLRDNGWKTYGLELNDETAYHARDILGLDIRTGDIRNAGFEKESMDVITLWHVLEHISEPFVTIKECYKLLKPGGLLAIAVPNFDSLQARTFGRYWFHLDIPYHLYHFSLKSLRILLEKELFRVVKVRHFSFEFNPFGYLQSFLNILGFEHNFLYNILKSKSIRRNLISGSPKPKLLLQFLSTACITPPLIPLALLMSAVESLLRKGGTIEIYAIKTGEAVK
jgi:2-polyprenyl-3-methyl-5-hydroxy-6-metoxy-1,4-benzoquinol methylase